MFDEMQSELGDEADDEPVAASSASASIRAITSGRAKCVVGGATVVVLLLLLLPVLLLSPTEE